MLPASTVGEIREVVQNQCRIEMTLGEARSTMDQGTPIKGMDIARGGCRRVAATARGNRKEGVLKINNLMGNQEREVKSRHASKSPLSKNRELSSRPFLMLSFRKVEDEQKLQSPKMLTTMKKKIVYAPSDAKKVDYCNDFKKDLQEYIHKKEEETIFSVPKVDSFNKMLAVNKEGKVLPTHAVQMRQKLRTSDICDSHPNNRKSDLSSPRAPFNAKEVTIRFPMNLGKAFEQLKDTQGTVTNLREILEPRQPRKPGSHLPSSLSRLRASTHNSIVFKPITSILTTKKLIVPQVASSKKQ